MGFFRDVQKASYELQRLSGDANALEKGRLTKRLVRRQFTRRIVGPMLNRLFR